MRRLANEGRKAFDGNPLVLQVDKDLESKLLITVAPDGYLRRV
jgi:cephalosporin hydroxylase